MHGLTGGGWKRKRYRPRLKRKLPAGKPRQERQTYSRTIRHRASPRPSQACVWEHRTRRILHLRQFAKLRRLDPQQRLDIAVGDGVLVCLG